MNQRSIKQIISGVPVGVIPGVRGSRSFPTIKFKDTDPFLMLDHIGPDPVGKQFKLSGKGHDHPHRGFETLSLVFEGTMNHRDSYGNKAFLKSGDVHRMNAGKGIIHGGSMTSDPFTGRFHSMQLWVNNPLHEKMSKPDIQSVSALNIPGVQIGPADVRVIAGNYGGLTGPVHMKATVDIVRVVSKKGAFGLGAFDASDKLMLYVMEGSIEVNGQLLKQFELADFENASGELTIKVNELGDFLLMAGRPLNEPLTFGGPFVMSTKEEIQQAYADFRNGLFGEIDYEK